MDDRTTTPNRAASTVPEADQAARWDEMYSERDQHWSGEPNGALLAEFSDVDPATALDVGCGEGADAIWLARRGWTVTGIDVSSVAIERARAAAGEAGVEVELITGDLVGSVPDGAHFDLVSASYLAVPRAAADSAVASLCAATARGGTLLMVGHDLAGSEHGRRHAEEHGFDPDDFVQVTDVVERLDAEWTVELHESRRRVMPPGFEGPDVPDVVLRARRTEP